VNFGELEPQVQKKYGEPPYQFWTEWNKNFPHLLTCTWQVIEGKVKFLDLQVKVYRNQRIDL
jgi:hypothetical protein